MKRLLCSGWLPTVLLLAALLPTTTFAQSDGGSRQSGQLTDESLGNLLRAMGLKPKLEKKRYPLQSHTRRQRVGAFDVGGAQHR